MQTRLRRATRLMRVQDRMRQRAEQELAGLERRVQAADTAQADLIRALNEASAFHEPLRATALHRLKSLAVTAQALRAERDVSAQQLLDRATQHKRTENWVDRLEAEHRRHREKQDWAERLDLLSAAAAPVASLPPAKPANGADEPDRPATAPRPVDPEDRTGHGPTHPDTSAP
ncbi:hypothetical protein SAMN05216360_10886 [Methylobacterium phyllostachyos]|uniref:Flagellar FliJ protein n=1 Tax=Methylobacterium phyllostachyos TaxID=582672 RepID=A0A1H0B8R6_9HYPH|nr:hypothetical protein [Methylobacterium phyllostachyos]SDN42040.1 hypothetical protein SAMN05216360_10886 [Methylobacterium phyllostachyos]